MLLQKTDTLPFDIVNMSLDDLPEVMSIECKSYSSPWPESTYRQELLNDRACFTLVKYQGHILGYSGLWHLADEIHIGTLVARPEVRRCGIGELLLVKAITHAYECMVNTVTLEVRPSNMPARNLYTKYGFEIKGRRLSYYADSGEDALIMTTPSLRSQTYRDRFQLLSDTLFDRMSSFRLDGFCMLA